MAVTVTRAERPTDYRDFGQLIREYTAWLSIEHAHDAWFIEAVLRQQSLEKELGDLPKIYAPPSGVALLGHVNGSLAGAVALRRLDASTCEMKRMFVRDRHRGQRVGLALRDAIIAEARSEGYTRMVLDTSRRLTTAIALYAAAGFRECPAYQNYPEELCPHLYFMEMRLA
jgi:GNAT superfamily N-acetyltransferase